MSAGAQINLFKQSRAARSFREAGVQFYRRTTIGAAAFHCRVRNGNGWGHCAIVTRGPSRTGTEPHWRFRCFAATQADADLWGPASAAADALQFLSAVSDRGYNIFERT